MNCLFTYVENNYYLLSREHKQRRCKCGLVLLYLLTGSSLYSWLPDICSIGFTSLKLGTHCAFKCV